VFEIRIMSLMDVPFVLHTLKQSLKWSNKRIVKVARFMQTLPCGLVLVKGEEPVGFMIYTKKGDTNTIKLITVLPAYRRKGGALALLLSPIVAYSQQNVDIPFEAEVPEDNLEAQMLFRKAGFKFRGRKTGSNGDKFIFRYKFMEEGAKENV
jgi:ribosomal protein S18 acetylase RimI-like enzyme